MDLPYFYAFFLFVCLLGLHSMQFGKYSLSVFCVSGAGENDKKKKKTQPIDLAVGELGCSGDKQLN